MQILRRYLGDNPLLNLDPVCHKDDVLAARRLIQTVHVHESLLDYIMRLTEATRADDGVAMGVSPRGSIALIRGARSLAAIRGRSYVIPDDIKELLVPVYAHRLILRGNVRSRTLAAQELMQQIKDNQPVPSENWPEQ
jgi:MoxR-like ATPase